MLISVNMINIDVMLQLVRIILMMVGVVVDVVCNYDVVSLVLMVCMWVGQILGVQRYSSMVVVFIIVQVEDVRIIMDSVLLVLIVVNVVSKVLLIRKYVMVQC